MQLLGLPFAETEPPRKRQRIPWTDEENRIIVSQVQRLGTQWDRIATALPGRTADAVRNQSHRLHKTAGYAGLPLVLDSHSPEPFLEDLFEEERKTGSQHGRSVWTAQEDRIISEGVRRFGCKWRRIASMLPGRSDSSVRNRWSRLSQMQQHEMAFGFGTEEVVDELTDAGSSSSLSPSSTHTYNPPACPAATAAAALYPHLLLAAQTSEEAWQPLAPLQPTPLKAAQLALLMQMQQQLRAQMHPLPAPQPPSAGESAALAGAAHSSGTESPPASPDAEPDANDDEGSPCGAPHGWAALSELTMGTLRDAPMQEQPPSQQRLKRALSAPEAFFRPAPLPHFAPPPLERPRSDPGGVVEERTALPAHEFDQLGSFAAGPAWQHSPEHSPAHGGCDSGYDKGDGAMPLLDLGGGGEGEGGILCA